MNGSRIKNIIQETLAAILLAVFCISAFALPVSAEDHALWTEPGDQIIWTESSWLDISNADQGYLITGMSEGSDRKRIMILRCNGTDYQYIMPSTTESIAVPLQMGSGTYQADFYENAYAKKYYHTGSVCFDVCIQDETLPFLYPSVYVDYTEETPAVKKADELCSGKTKEDAFKTIRNYINSLFTYDYIEMITIKSAALPDIDRCFESQMGICQDLAAMACCMMRSQGIPCRLVFGFADGNYHAWTEYLIDGTWKMYDPVVGIGNGSFRKYIPDRYY